MEKYLKIIVIFLSFVFIPIAFSQTSNTMSATSPNQSATSQYISDATITSKVKASLFADKNISSLAVSVTTKNGVVTLKGTVPDITHRQKVMEITRSIIGVKSVVDKMVIKK